MHIKPKTNIINIISISLQLLLLVILIEKKKYFNFIGTTFILVLFIIFIIYEKKKGILITDFIRISVIITLLSNSFLGDYLGLYYSSAYFDKALHIFGSFSFSIFIFSIFLGKGHFKGVSKTFIFISILLIGSFIGTMFEIGEFICDQIFQMKNQNGLVDTDLDMICNTVGAAIAGIFVLNKDSYLDKIISVVIN